MKKIRILLYRVIRCLRKMKYSLALWGIVIILVLAFYDLQKEFKSISEIISETYSITKGLGYQLSLLNSVGIIIGILTFISNSPKPNKYLGVDKTDYIIEKSISYKIIKSNFFIMLLILCLLVPVIISFIPVILGYLNLETYFDVISIMSKIIWFVLIIFYITILVMQSAVSVKVLLERTLSFEIKLKIEKKIDSSIKKNFIYTYENSNYSSNYSDFFDKIYSNVENDNFSVYKICELGNILSKGFNHFREPLINDRMKFDENKLSRY